MIKRRLRIFCRRRCLIYGLCLLLPCLSVELFSFWFASFFWTIPTNLTPNSTTILIVADPQLIGERNEPKWIGWLSRWDSDRYLHRGYSQAIASTQPDMDIYLGDLFDEGILLNDEQFTAQKDRFHRIFPRLSSKNRIYLPGDNDIGGEMEPVNPDLLERFEKQFQPYFSNLNAFKFLTIYKTNPARYGDFQGIYGEMANDSGEDRPHIRFLLSHAPIVPHMSAKMEQGLRKMSIVLSGHDHKTSLYMQWRMPTFRKTASTSEVTYTRWTLSMDDPAALPLIEFKVPTCSYRMGVPTMGYGLLVLSPFPANQTALAQLSVLWLPSRYTQLTFYALLLVVMPFSWTLFAWIWRKCRRGEPAKRKVLKSKKKRDEEKKRTWTATAGTSAKYARIGFDV